MIFRFSSSLGIRTPEIVQPRIDSMTDERPDAELRVGVLGDSIIGGRGLPDVGESEIRRPAKRG